MYPPSANAIAPLAPGELPRDSETDLPAWHDLPVERHRGAAHGAATEAIDAIAAECPVALVINGISHAVMMCTPRDLEAFAIGFALTEGIVARSSDIRDIEVAVYSAIPRIGAGAAPPPGSEVNAPATFIGYAEVRLTIVQQAFAELKAKRRAMTGRTGCGVCGIESITLLDLSPERVPVTDFFQRLAPDAIARAVQAMPALQILMRATGGVHAAAWCDAAGAIQAVYEDVGRHNALDKLLGALTVQRRDLTDGFILMSSRASYELVRKAARLGVPMLATISAPTTLAISIARAAGIRLVCFCRADTFVEYAPAAT
jgi:FdhD protein